MKGAFLLSFSLFVLWISPSVSQQMQAGVLTCNGEGWYFDNQKCEYCANQYCKCSSFLGCTSCISEEYIYNGTVCLPNPRPVPGCLTHVQGSQGKNTTISCSKCKPGWLLISNSYCVQKSNFQGSKKWISTLESSYTKTDFECLEINDAKLGNCSKLDKYYNCQCDSGYYLNQCRQCQKCDINNCDTCYYDQCTKCKPGFFIDYNENGMTCSPCTASNCQECTTKGAKECKKCLPGYYLDGSSLCKPCTVAQCKFCTATTCNTCNDNTTLIQAYKGVYTCTATQVKDCAVHKNQTDQSSPQCQICAKGFYLDTTSNTCIDCQIKFPNSVDCTATNALECKTARTGKDDVATRTKNIAAVAQQDYYLQTFKGVKQCVRNDNICQNLVTSKNTTCDTCYPATAYINGVCNATLQIANCAVRNAKDGSKCDQCVQGYFLTSTYKCDACVDNCLRCEGARSNCLECQIPFILNEKQCWTKCLDGCEKCPNTYKCDSCLTGYQLISGYEDKCIACDSKNLCLTCTNPGQNTSSCSVCRDGYYPALTKRLKNPDVDIKTCVPCPKGCLKCSSQDGVTATCITCSKAFQISQNGTCFERSFMCTNWAQEQCTECAYGSYLTEGRCYKFYDFVSQAAFGVSNFPKPGDGYDMSSGSEDISTSQTEIVEDDPYFPPIPVPAPDPSPDITYSTILILSQILALLFVTLMI